MLSTNRLSYQSIVAQHSKGLIIALQLAALQAALQAVPGSCHMMSAIPASLCVTFHRWEQGVQAKLLQHPALAAGPLSLLVLDNTYCHPG